MNLSRPSLDSYIDQDPNLQAARSLQSSLENASLQLLRNISEFNSHSLDSDESSDTEDIERKDPAIIANDVAAQISYLRKLKFQYLEQNAKAKYIKSIVSDIDDAPIVTAEDNKKLAAVNEEKKAKLKIAKDQLNEVHRNIRLLAPMVEEDYVKVKQASERATQLAQKIIDARLALTRLRQAHPKPRLTVPMADQMLIDQVIQMQTLSDEAQNNQKNVQAMKEKVKADALEVENLRMQRAEIEKEVKTSRVEEDDARLTPLYDWYNASLTLHRHVQNLHVFHSVSENELRLTYRIDTPVPSQSRNFTIILVFAPDTRQLADAQVAGIEDLNIDLGETIESHVLIDDVHGLVAAVLERIRNFVNP